MANSGESGPLAGLGSSQAGDTGRSDESKSTAGPNATAGAANPAKKAPVPGGGTLKDLKPLVPRKQTMMGLGAPKPPPGPIPNPLSGISSAMQRPSPPTRAKAPTDATATPAPAPSPSGGPRAVPVVAAAPAAKPALPPAPPPVPGDPTKKATSDRPKKPPVASADAGPDPDGVEVTADALDDADPAKAYVSPRIVPKAALPTNEEAAKVVINLPDGGGAEDEAATAKRLAEETARLNAQRRREPTVRIPRQTVEAARSEIAAREGRRNGDEEISVDVAAAGSQLDSSHIELTPLAGESKRGGRGGLVVAMAVVVAAAAGGVWYVGRSAAPTPTSLASNTDALAKTSTPAATPVESKTAAPPLELTADPPAKTADPSVVTLNAAAADAPSTASPADPNGAALHALPGSAPVPGALAATGNNVAVNGGWHPTTAPMPHAPTPPPQTTQPPAIKPAAAPKTFTPSSI